MAAVSGLVAYTVWYIVRDIVGFAGLDMNVFKAMVSGVLAGILGFAAGAGARGHEAGAVKAKGS